MQAARAFAPALLLVAAALAGCTGAPAPSEGSEPVGPTAGPPASPPVEGTNLPPTARIEFTPLLPVAGQPITFLDRSTDPDDGIGGRVWEFPEGTTSRLARVTHTFGAAGKYLVKLVVSDKAGQTSTATALVTVAASALDIVPEGPRSHAVVAVVDTGINPYHAAFRAPTPLPPPEAYLEAYPVDALPLVLTLGRAYDDARAADEAAWAKVEVGQLYYVPGTRIVGAISFGLGTFGNAAPNQVPVLDEDGHGTATASRVAFTSPDALIVVVETGADTLDEAIAWAAGQPWIDIVSISIGPVANVPLQWPAYQLGALELATREAWDAGKLVFAAAGNEPTLSPTGYLSGPTWVVSVGGALPGVRGDPATSSKGMDMVGDYAPQVALHESADATEPRAGTSFSTPNVAAVAAQALHLARAQSGWQEGIRDGKLTGPGVGLLQDGLTNRELREALQGVARYWDTPGWAPSVSAPVAPAPWVQMGWGYLGSEDVPALVRALLTGEVPAKPDDARLYMAAVMAARQAMWG